MAKVKVLYHANCNDGSAAALAAYLKFGPNDNEYIPVQYGSPPPELDGGEDVYILDFSYPMVILKEMARVANKIVLIDHHKTAMDSLAPKQAQAKQTQAEITWNNITIHLNMEHSGAVLAWRYFFQADDVPTLFELIEDRDLWQFKYKATQAVTRALPLYPNWMDWRINSSGWLEDLISSGETIRLFMENEAKKIVKNPPIFWDYTGTTIPLYNLPGFMISDTLHLALETYPETPYAVAFFDLPDRRIYSLRSRQGSDVDVSEIAKRFGGGGHKHAAGFPVFFKKCSCGEAKAEVQQ